MSPASPRVILPQDMAAALVTGASRGIGRAVAARLAREGHDVGIGYGASAAAAEELAAELRAAGVRAVTAGGDLADPSTPHAVVERVEAELGPVEVLVANAGVGTPPRRIEEIGLDEFDRLLAVNLRAPFLLCRRLVPAMIQRGFGRVVLMSSVAAYTGGMIGAHYASSKAALHGLAHSLAKQGAAHGVTVNVVAPALVESDMLPREPGARERLAGTLPVGRFGTAEEVADLVAAVVANGYLTNQSLLLDGGMHPT